MNLLILNNMPERLNKNVCLCISQLTLLNNSQFAASFSKYQLNLSLQDQVIVLELYTDKLRDLARVYHTITGCCSWLHWFIFFCLRLKHTVYGADHLEHHNRHHTCCVWIWCKEVHQAQQCAFNWTSWRGNAWVWIWGWKMNFFFTNVWTFLLEKSS